VRFVLTVHDVDVLDVQLHWPWSTCASTDDAPKLEASGGGQAERAEPYGDPATISGFGFQR
jgi:hypothetical protein